METQAKVGRAGTGNYIDANAAERSKGWVQDPNGDIDGADKHKRKIGEYSLHHKGEPGNGSDGGKRDHREWSLQDSEKDEQMVRENSASQQGTKEDHRRSGQKEEPLPQDTEERKRDERPKDDNDCLGPASLWSFMKWPWFWNR